MLILYHPKLITDVNIDTIFGILFYVEMIPIQQFNQFIPVRTEFGIIEYPIITKRMVFSEEIKEIIKLG